MSEAYKNFSQMLHYASACIDYVQLIQAQHSCDDCAGREKPLCPYLPECGDMVRINCPLWYKEKKGE